MPTITIALQGMTQLITLWCQLIISVYLRREINLKNVVRFLGEKEASSYSLIIFILKYLDVYLYVLLPVFQARFVDFKIQNMVGSCDVRFPIRLESLVLTHSQFSRYFSQTGYNQNCFSQTEPFFVLLICALVFKSYCSLPHCTTPAV